MSITKNLHKDQITFLNQLQIYVHNPGAFPEVGERGIILSKGTVNLLSVSAQIIET